MSETRLNDLEEFTPFSELPAELRIKIWGYAVRAPRLLELQYCIVDRKFLSFQTLPSILHTCTESRAVALSYFHLSFGSDKHPPSTYFNPVDDILYFGSEQYDDEIEFMIRHFDKHGGALEPRDQIQHLALAEYLWQREYDYSLFTSRTGNVEWSIRKFSRIFPHLKRLIFVRGRKVPIDSEGEKEEIFVPEGQSGRKNLVNCEPDLDLIRDPCSAMGAAISWFDVLRKEHPERTFPEIVLMELEYL